MNAEQLARALTRAPRDHVVVVENKRGGRIEVDGVRFGRGRLVILTLWKPPGGVW